VVGREDADGLVKPLAFAVLRPGTVGSDELAGELKAFLKEALAPYKYPRWFAWRESLPRNDRGKVARKELRAEAASASLALSAPGA
jgi:acyl-coenzyme A synthetase/AMP-(fatty) acid ligase